jgi:2-polyprenyl-3-methyl-5-hydroxy-6-metoxy-1,4-benzoquinol methylase
MNPLIQELIDLNIINQHQIVDYFPRVRDREDVSALKCNESGVIFLNRVDHMAESYYNEKSGTSYWNEGGRNQALLETKEDDDRRFNQFKSLVENKKYCDIGCGLGGVLERMSKLTGTSTRCRVTKRNS